MKGIKSKERVQVHGEVFTPDSIVNDMLDLVDNQLDKQEIWKYIDTTYLEPSCGNGNFLIRILDRKLKEVQRLPKEEWNLALVHSVASIYGIDIQPDNVAQSKVRMLEIIKNGSVEVLELQDKEKKEFSFEKFDLTDELEKVIKFILDLNIQTGNCLTGKAVEYGEETDKHLLITEYTWNGIKVKRREIAFENLIQQGNIMYNSTEKEYTEEEYLSIHIAKEIKKSDSLNTTEDDEYDF